jgi:hypothetical protein
MSAVTTSTTNVSAPHSPKDARQSHFSISKFVAKLRLRAKRTENIGAGTQQLDTRPPLASSPLPLVLPQHQGTLSNLGWTTITFPQPASHSSLASAPTSPAHPLQVASQALFAAAQAFFAQPASEKQRWKHRLASEEGWSHIPGEKEFITLRTLAYTPDVLKEPARRYWQLMGTHMISTLDRISTSVGLPNIPSADAGFAQFVGPCATMGATEADKTATMLRIFRYEGWEAKVVAEPHADLGLLSSVVGDVPGLEVWDGTRFFDVERHYEGGTCATMLAGRQLERFSNGRYPAGGHRVVSYGRAGINERQPSTASPQTERTGAVEKPQYRHSIVFVLRAHEPMLVHSAALETQITGKWKEPVEGVTVGVLYEQIRKAHFNINIDKAEREKQKRKVAEAKANKVDKEKVLDGKGSG